MRIRQTAFVMPAAMIVAAAHGQVNDSERDFQLETKLTRSSAEQERDLLNGSVDVAITAMDNIIAWNERGGDFVIVAQVESTTPLTLVSSPERSRIDLLRGARLAVDAVDCGFVIVLRAIIAEQGLSDSCTLVALGGVKQRYEALLQSECDATLLGPPFDLLAQSAGFSILLRASDRWPEFPGQGLVVRRSRLAEIRPMLKKYVEIWQRSLEWINLQREATAEILAAANVPAPAIDTILAMQPANLVPSRAGIELLIRMRQDLRLLPSGTIAVDSLVDYNLLQET